MSKTPSPAQLRQLIFKFYNENDPAKVQMGLDINGIVEWTMRNGVDALNEMLMKQFNKKIDINEDTGNAREKFQRVSMGLTFSTQIARKEHEYRMKLHEYFNKTDKAVLDPAKEAQFEKFVKFAMLNGMDKLNEKLVAKYGVAVGEAGSGSSPNGGAKKKDANRVDSEPDKPVVAMGKFGANPFGLDVDRLKDDLAFFYEEMEDEEQLEVLDDITDWACQIGIEEFNDKIEQMYGQSLNEFLSEKGRKPHKNTQTPPPQAKAVVAPPPQAKAVVAAKSAEDSEDDSDEDGEKGFGETAGGAMNFEDMTDDEIKAELSLFYNKYDPDNLEKLDQVCALARTLGREELNNKLNNIYGDKLTPLKTTAPKQKATPNAVSKVILPGTGGTPGPQMAKPPGLGFQTGYSTRLTPQNLSAVVAQSMNKPPAPEKDAGSDDEGEEAAPPIPPRFTADSSLQAEFNLNEQSFEGIGEEGHKTMDMPYNTDPIVTKDDILDDLPLEATRPSNVADIAAEAAMVAAMGQGGMRGSIEDVLASERDAWRNQIQNNVPANETEFQRMAREKRERNEGGKSRVRGEDGKIVEINILLDACNKYRLDVLTGICTCGFSKSDHSKASKYKINAMLEDEKNLRNSRGLLDVKNLVKNLSKNAPPKAKESLPQVKFQTKQVKRAIAGAPKKFGKK